jgi:hypothetical protein
MPQHIICTNCKESKKQGMVEAAQRVLNVFKARVLAGHSIDETIKGVRAECVVIIEYNKTNPLK